jgi:hypothetical protein
MYIRKETYQLGEPELHQRALAGDAEGSPLVQEGSRKQLGVCKAQGLYQQVYNSQPMQCTFAKKHIN